MLAQAGTPALQPPPFAWRPASAGPVADTRARVLRDLRISVTDRCNFRCSYCMPREAFGPDHPFLPHGDLLSFEEIARLARIFVQRGVTKLRLTGGEPLLRRNIEALIAQLSPLRTMDGRPIDIALTTNGSLLTRKAAALADAGLRRVTVSLDALEPALFAELSDSKVSVHEVLRGIDAASAAGLAPIKVNVVVRRGVNDDQILPIARHFRGSSHIVRFIEYMDVGNTNGWRPEEVVSGAQILARIGEAFPIEPLPGNAPGEVARRWRYVDGGGEIGVITSISQTFCGDCNRARLSPEGGLYLCLFASQGHDLRALLRSGASDAAIAATLDTIWSARTDAYSEQRAARGADPSSPRIEMSYIGG
ncbi:GTP 3',8-cyclase MoaA [Verticiella sediminum]|uniref:GTP 3',8-cyclase n=1 Tax=Verticiella sediminum TaxID=1247510 RepID=A0A556A882_9BURK|nr:GTP 3',8-cyclase MoaA [Verticiella sediminum]TSH89092.1 GTP 3',8-cyclase MoaA [Verticiella sediminum]